MKQLILDLLEAWNSHDIERVTTFYAPDYEGVDVGQAEAQRGPDGIRQMLANYWQAFPDLEFTGDGILVDDNRAVLVWTAHGTHRGRFMNIPSTGQRIEVRGVSLLTVDKDRVTHGLYLWDVAGLLRAIGLLPDL